MEEYLSALKENPGLRQEAEQLLTVSISRFFRDRHVWENLKTAVLPSLLASNPPRLRVWSAGCARGEEVYSFKIIWERVKEGYEPLPDLELWATDLNPAYLEKAEAGVYSPSSLKEVPAGWRKLYLIPASRRFFTVSENLRQGIIWKQHDLIRDMPPGDHFEIIFLRNNLLTYYKKDVSLAALRKVTGHLVCGGFLVIGVHESLPADISDVKPFSSSVYRRASER